MVIVNFRIDSVESAWSANEMSPRGLNEWECCLCDELRKWGKMTGFGGDLA